ncbi:MAG: SOS response-associated peptidase [Cyanobacteria bacterium P01_E01_bin.34]
MCGRYSLASSAEQVAELFCLDYLPPVLPRYNISPSQPIATIRTNLRGDREFAFALWGLIPIWLKDPNDKGPRPINARAETISEKRMFNGLLRHKRCLIPADGFYEWKKEDGTSKQRGGKRPFHVHFADRQPFSFAGLWSQWNGPNGEELESCTIVTTAANAVMQNIHNRMPVILPKDCYSDWLNPQIQSSKVAISMLQRTTSEPLVLTEVSALVNNPRNDIQDCITPLTVAASGGSEPELAD